MFVKICNRQNHSTKVYEVDRVQVNPDNANDQVIVDMEYNGEQNAYVCQPGVHTIYLMNKDGKTIDSYRT